MNNNMNKELIKLMGISVNVIFEFFPKNFIGINQAISRENWNLKDKV